MTPQLYKQFIEVNRWLHDPPVDEECIATYLLYHPRSPNPEPFYQILTGEDGPKRMFRLHDGAKSSAHQKGGCQALRAAYLCRHKRENEKASIIEDLVQFHVPVAWQWRDKVYAECARDPKIHHSHNEPAGSSTARKDISTERITEPAWQ